MYHKDPETDTARIVGFEVTPKRFQCFTPTPCVFLFSFLFLFMSRGWGGEFFSALLFSHDFIYSINHEYKVWDDKNPQVTTCNENTKKLVPGSTVPQEVDADKEVVFTYDVSFMVFSY